MDWEGFSNFIVTIMVHKWGWALVVFLGFCWMVARQGWPWAPRSKD